MVVAPSFFLLLSGCLANRITYLFLFLLHFRTRFSSPLRVTHCMKRSLHFVIFLAYNLLSRNIIGLLIPSVPMKLRRAVQRTKRQPPNYFCMSWILFFQVYLCSLVTLLPLRWKLRYTHCNCPLPHQQFLCPVFRKKKIVVDSSNVSFVIISFSSTASGGFRYSVEFIPQNFI